MISPAQTRRAKRLAGMTAAALGIVALAIWTFEAWLSPPALLALLTSLSFCG
jgi:hypothetical protein